MSAPVQKRHQPIRSCVVCRQTSEKKALLRVVRLPQDQGGAVVVDKTGKRSGRGAYICPDTKCISVARLQKRFERSLKLETGPLSPELFEELAGLVAPTTSG